MQQSFGNERFLEIWPDNQLLVEDYSCFYLQIKKKIAYLSVILRYKCYLETRGLIRHSLWIPSSSKDFMEYLNHYFQTALPLANQHPFWQGMRCGTKRNYSDMRQSILSTFFISCIYLTILSPYQSERIYHIGHAFCIFSIKIKNSSTGPFVTWKQTNI